MIIVGEPTEPHGRAVSGYPHDGPSLNGGAMTQENPLTWEAFIFLAGEAGLDPQDPHMEELFPYVQNVLGGWAGLHEIDTADFEPDMAFIPAREEA